MAASVGFDRVAVGVTPISKLKMHLPKFVAACKDDEDDVQFLARIELDAEGIMGSYTRLENDACIASLCNGGRMNRVFELAGWPISLVRCQGLMPSPRPRRKGKRMPLGKLRSNVQERPGRRRENL
jgi:hypothetical protein